jgi:phosphoglycerate dehydrogenase-like enzyme
MKKIVSFFGERSVSFELLNARAKEYAVECDLDYCWVPQAPFSQKDVIWHLRNADAGIIDVEPYGEDIFREISDTTSIVVRFGAGYDKVDLGAASRYGIAVARTTGANTMGVAEMALMLILASRRELKANMERVRSGKWGKSVVNETVGGRIGILGFGAIGRALAGLLQGFSCDLLACDPCPDREAAKALGVRLVDVDELFETSDVISIHVPYSPETHHFVNAERLSKMKPSSVIVNTARGGVIDEDALYNVLLGEKIRGAALDVFSCEPLSPVSPLLKLNNIIMTPHVSSQTMESLWRIYKMAIDIICDFFAGKGSPHILNQDRLDGVKCRS